MTALARSGTDPVLASSRKGAWSDACVIPLQNTKRWGVSHNSAAMGCHSFNPHDRGAGASDTLALPAGLPPSYTTPMVLCNLLHEAAHEFECLHLPSYHIGTFSSAFVLVDLQICRASSRPARRNSVTARGGGGDNLLLPTRILRQLLRRPIPLEYPGACNLIAGSVQGPHRFLQGSPAFVYRSRTSP
jgi:hypothetical protein